jgi:metallophosphoesterase (TIGR00282 family)
MTKRLREQGCDAIIVNAENAAEGTGLTVKQYEQLCAAGVDAITLGDHIYKKREIQEILSTKGNIVKPANFPAKAPGKNFCVVQTQAGIPIAVVSLMGRVFMRPINCPFEAIERVLEQIPPEVRIRWVDLHAEATSDKQAMGYFLDGRVSAILGTHTHVTTADEQILGSGTAFQCDIGMTGAYKSILGREIQPVLKTTLTFDPNTFHVDPQTGLAKAIGRLQWKATDQAI